MRRKGRFGLIEVVDREQQRALFLNGQQQGASYLRPSAAIVSEELDHGTPGPISSSAYPLGWLLAAVMNPSASAVMSGLGSGSGAVQLLYNFPHVDLTIVEIDPVMVQVALDSYPLLNYYLDQGRLNIAIADASDFFRQQNDVWDFGCADAYDGSSELLDKSLEPMCLRCNQMYVNVIDRLAGESMKRVDEVMSHCGKQPAEVIRAVPPIFRNLSPTTRTNWILTSEVPDIERAVAFVPFSDIDDVHAVDTQLTWDHFLTDALSTLL